MADHSSMDTVFFKRALECRQCIWQMFLFKAYCYFKGTLAVTHLSVTVIISGDHLQWFSIFKVTVLAGTSTCSHPIFQRNWINLQFQLQPSTRWIALSIAARHSFEFTAFLQNRNGSKKKSQRHQSQPSIYSMVVSLFHGSTWSNQYVKETVFNSQYLL